MPGLKRPTKTKLWRDERGFTLHELLVVIAILGILIVIGLIVFLGLLESWRVEAATNQLKADMRLAHTSATAQLTDWRVVLVPDKGDEDEGPDYYLVKLLAPYPATSPSVVDPATPPKPRTFPANVKVTNIAGSIDTGAGGWAVPPTVLGHTRTVEFNTDGTMRFYGVVSGSTCVTIDSNPTNKLTVLAATSRIKVKRA